MLDFQSLHVREYWDEVGVEVTVHPHYKKRASPRHAAMLTATLRNSFVLSWSSVVVSPEPSMTVVDCSAGVLAVVWVGAAVVM